jgi:hypothetical protein
MKLQFADYHGPTGLYVATGEALLPLAESAGATAFLGAGLQSGTIDPELCEQIQSAVAAAIGKAAPAAAALPA